MTRSILHIIVLVTAFTVCMALDLPPKSVLTEEEAAAIARKYGQDFLASDDPAAQKILNEAFAASPAIDCDCTLKNVKSFTFDAFKTCRIRRHVTEDGATLLRMDCFKADTASPDHIYIQNENGQFIMANGEWNAVMEILDLHRLDFMAEPIFKEAARTCVFTMRDTTFDKRPCHEVTVRMLPIYRIIRFQAPTMPAMYTESTATEGDAKLFIGGEAGRKCAVTRVYVIDKENKFIYKRADYNMDGRLLKQWSVATADFSPIRDTSIFIEGEMATPTLYFTTFDAVFRPSDAKSTPIPPPRHSWKRIWLITMDTLLYSPWTKRILCVIGTAVIIGAIILRIRQSRRQ